MYQKHLAAQLMQETDLALEAGNKDWAFAGIALKGASFLLGAVYLEDGQGLQGDNLLRLEAIRRFLAGAGRPFVLLGDFNMTPEELAGGGWLDGLGAGILKPHDLAATCTSGAGRMLDFGVASPLPHPRAGAQAG